jgi:TonB family protein
MKYFFSALMLLAFSPLLRAQADQAPEATNLAAVQNMIGYPADAKDARIEGKVLARVTIDESGNVISSEIVESPSSILSEAVSKKIDNLKFNPAKLNGKPSKSKVEVPFIFVLPKNLPVVTSLEEALANPESVVELDLSDQKLSSLDPRIASLKKLQKINLDDNNFSKFPSVLSKLPLLEEISITGNSISSVPGSLKKLDNLHFIDLRENPIPKATTVKIREMLENVDEVLLD